MTIEKRAHQTKLKNGSFLCTTPCNQAGLDTTTHLLVGLECTNKGSSKIGEAKGRVHTIFVETAKNEDWRATCN
jgi:hypothetical protein